VVSGCGFDDVCDHLPTLNVYAKLCDLLLCSLPRSHSPLSMLL
jgi:hypothetical protein